jgi:hypothetical protein
MSDNFEEYKTYKIKHSLAITESTVELMDVMTRMIKMLNKVNIPYELNLDKFDDDSVHIGYHWGSFEIKINKFPLVIEIVKDCDYSPWKYEIVDREVRYFDVLTTIFENKKKMIKCFIQIVGE